MQGIMANPKMILDYIGHHIARVSRPSMKVPFLFIQDGEDYYCLKVSGDSLTSSIPKNSIPKNSTAKNSTAGNSTPRNSFTSENDENEEMVLVKRTEEAKNGDIIVGVVDGAPMLKRYKKFENRIELHSANSNDNPIIVTEDNDFRVAGIFVGHFNE